MIITPDTALKERIEKGLEKLESELQNPESKQVLFEQYKLLIDSAHRIEERRKDSNTIFITINSILTPFLIKFYEVKELTMQNILLLSLLILLGIFICADWLRIIASFKNLNYINYSLIQTFEKHLPSSIFSLRATMQVAGSASHRANVILEQETIIPKLFIGIYITCFIVKIYFFKIANIF